ncbi:MAG: exonuclease SbcC [Limosilactobacillus sp.]|uniref:exonuclease SbcC n=1 Tax=Limosilactobacillus sp. TaxID=2773925 RepID=UPI0026F9C4CE|nr:exonuclease SbcC [Limosilactobacillus sp.]
MANVEHAQQAVDMSSLIQRQVSTKIKYLQELNQAVESHHDRKIYQLLDNRRYAAEIEHREQQPNDQGVMSLVDDMADHLSNYLSENLIKYLGQTYPFFYYEEYQMGHYRIYFGNWWDRRVFGELDVLNVRFAFNQEEYAKLSKSFELARQNKRYNSDRIEQVSNQNDHLQELIDTQDQRDRKRRQLEDQLEESNSRTGIFESNRNKETRQELLDQIQKLEDQDHEARSANKTIKENEQVLLALSKENTILSYEQKSIIDAFGSFEDFELANRNLYANYLAMLEEADKEEKQVTDDEQ